MANKTKKSGCFGALLLAVCLCGLMAIGIWVFLFKNNVNLKHGKASLNIHTGWTAEQVYAEMEEKDLIKNMSTLKMLLNRGKYAAHVHPGHYVFTAGMNNLAIAKMLRGGHQTAVKLTFNNIRTKAELAGEIAQVLEIDSTEFLSQLNDSAYLSSKGFTKDNAICLFIPNTYELYWNTSSEKLLQRMNKEYKAFWNNARTEKARKLGLNSKQVITLASIVQSEQQVHSDERNIIAGLYLNRLKKGMKLESDPTVVYAVGDFSIRRVLDIHKQIDSPYNTYMHEGLPPGPILIPDISSIDAVLNPDHNNFIFMCAKEDFSNYHNFTDDYNVHLKNARLFRAALDKRNIFH